MIDGQDHVDNSARGDSAREHRLTQRRELYRIYRAAETPEQSKAEQTEEQLARRH